MDSRILICTDLDRTLLPNGLEKESPNARNYFSKYVSRPEVTLAYVTGRHRALVEKAMKDYSLPQPDYVLGDVGSTIYTMTQEASGNKRSWLQWEDEIASDWAGLSHRDLKNCFDDFSVLRLQEPEKQNTYKLSYYLPMDADPQNLISLMRERLEAREVKASFVHSIDVLAKVALLDVLPESATKVHAIRFLMRHLNFSIENTVFSGDSGNDLEVLSSPIQAVLVANSTAEIRDKALALSAQKGNAEALYLAQGGFMGMNGNYSAGILEGIAYFLPQTKPWLGLEKKGNLG